MQKTSYPNFVRRKHIDKVINFKEERVFKLSIPISKKGKESILIISRAPKPCSDQGGSKMISRALKYINDNKESFKNIYKVCFVYIFPILEYDSHTLENVLKEKGEKFLTGEDGINIDGGKVENSQIISEEIKASDYIIFAWGEPPKALSELYNVKIEEILKNFKLAKMNTNNVKKAYIVGDLTKKGYAKHCLSWSSKYELVEYEL
ncbi:Protein of unknown function [Clostridium cavendishii DSM 21758]|uniref:DUF1643 domain-containing protein n=1 Tax=Clostridium cavendishii DSM 21758 TaxID=1121302 RepID=A0A1M6PGJ5_9CLOT|nr:DUF1643 domain-containing protein [Clostridium cavendishii]SHK07075.1 Protein of unknown function [Clostridium cavendishii DSM 21758]